MSHRIPIFLSDAERLDEGPTAPGLTGFVAFASSFTLGVCLNSIFPLLILAVFLVFYFTNEQFGMNVDQVRLWKRYRSLTSENQKIVNLSPKYVRELRSGDDWRMLLENVRALEEAEARVKRAQGFEIVASQRYQDAFQAAINAEIDKAFAIEQHEAQVRKELERRGW